MSDDDFGDVVFSRPGVDFARIMAGPDEAAWDQVRVHPGITFSYLANNDGSPVYTVSAGPWCW